MEGLVRLKMHDKSVLSLISIQFVWSFHSGARDCICRAVKYFTFCENQIVIYDNLIFTKGKVFHSPAYSYEFIRVIEQRI